MSSQMGALLASGLDELRYEPIGKRIRAMLGGGTAVDSTRGSACGCLPSTRCS
jgi:hypothetical protein